MKLPVPAPQIADLLNSRIGDLGTLLSHSVDPEIDGVYAHWDKIRHLTPPHGLTHEQWWLCIKFKRVNLGRSLDTLLDKRGEPFRVSLTDTMQRRLHFIDREAAGAIKGVEHVNGQTRFLIRSLIEEAMTSSQLEGASTTRAVAKEMLSTGRAPRDLSERMIYNNYEAMNLIRERGKRPFTVDEIFELHRILTDGTLEDARDAGRLRDSGDNVVIYDRGTPPTLLHVPPSASELQGRLQRLCDFANDQDKNRFVHPVVRAIAIHFQIGFDHPFVDGNGRTARALFYWSMLNSGYWMTEYLSISSILKKAPAQYVRAYLYTESDGCDLSYFVAQQLEVIEKSIVALHEYIKKKLEEDNAAHRVLKNARIGNIVLNHRQKALLANALAEPDRGYTIASHRTAHTISYPTALMDLNTLVKAELLQRVRAGKNFIFYPVANLRKRLC